jgi:hypothetical protein
VKDNYTVSHLSWGKYLTNYIKQDEFFKENKIVFDKDKYDLYLSSDCVLDGEWLQIKGKNAIGTLDNLLIGEFIGYDVWKSVPNNMRLEWAPMGNKPPKPIVFAGENYLFLLLLFLQ